MGLGGVRVFLTEHLAACLQCDLMHLARLFMEARGLIKRTQIAGYRGSLFIVLAKLRVGDFQCPQEVAFGGFQIVGSLVKKTQVVGHRSDIHHERWLVALEELDCPQPVLRCLVHPAHVVVGSPQGRVESADLAHAVRAVLKLVERLAVVVARKFRIAQLTVQVSAGFECAGECINAVEIGAQCLLRFFHRGIGRMQSLLEITGGA